MPDNKKEYATRPMERLLSAMRSRFGASTRTNKTFNIANHQDSVISRNELMMLKKRSSKSPLRLSDVKNNINSVSSNIAERIGDASEMATMVPELRKARMVLISSIMSPSDMHGTNLIINVNAPELKDSDIEQKIASLISGYVNDELRLGSSISNWIGDALFKTGSSPVMVVPKSLVELLYSDTDVSEEQLHAMVTQLSKSKSDRLKLVDAASIDVTNFAGKTSGLIASNEALFPVGANKKPKLPSKTIVNNYAKSVKDKMKDHLVVTADFTMMLKPEKTKKTSDGIENSIVNVLTKTNSGNILSLSSKNLDSDENEPYIVKLPATSCIPIIIPGVESEHLGYFVALDEHGSPLNISDNRNEQCLFDSEENFLTTMSIIKESKHKSNSDSSRKLADAMFELSIKTVLDKAVNNMGLAGADLPEKNKLFSAIFARIMQDKKVNVVFVPRSMLSYYAFDYRSDGTGKPLIEDIAFIVAMRTSFLISRVLATINNAVDQKKITFSMEDQLSSNVEQIMEAMNEAYMEKYMYRFDHNPMAATRNLVSRSVTIQPTDMAGVHNLNIDSSTEQRQASVPDDALEERLTKMILLNTDVPPSVLDEVGENEFSRSVAASHILFSNAIRDYQTKVSDITNILVRALLRYSKSLRTEINKLISDVKSSKDDNDNQVDDFLEYVIGRVSVSLPPPNVAPDKSKFEEMDTITSAIENVFEKMFSEDLVAIDDSEIKSALTAMKAYSIREAVKETMGNLGGIDMADVPGIDDIKFDAVSNYTKQLINYSAGFKRMKKNLMPSEDDNDDNGY